MRFTNPICLAALAAVLLPLVGAAPTLVPSIKIKIPGLDAELGVLNRNKLLNVNINEPIEGSYIVCYNNTINSTAAASHEALIARFLSKRDGFIGGISATYTMGTFKGYNIKADAATLAQIAKAPEVAWIEKDAKVYASALTTQANSQYGLSRVSHRAKGATNMVFDSSAGAGTNVYVIDTGILTTHSEFGGRASWGANFVAGSPNTDENGHGTHCAGTVAGATFGVAKRARVVAVKVLNAQGAGANSAVISGIQWVTKNAAPGSVISMSLGGSQSAAVNNAVIAAINAGVTVVAAAGNEGQDAGNVSPANVPAVITVGAIDNTDAKPSFSNFGTSVDVFAPGVRILSAWIGSNTATNTVSGTSMACPHVAGLAAYLITLENLASPAAVQNRIKQLGTSGTVTGAGPGSPNLIAYNGSGA